MLRPKQIYKHRVYQKKLLKAFDRVLQDDRFKSKAENVLEKATAIASIKKVVNSSILQNTANLSVNHPI